MNYPSFEECVNVWHPHIMSPISSQQLKETEAVIMLRWIKRDTEKVGNISLRSHSWEVVKQDFSHGVQLTDSQIFQCITVTLMMFFLFNLQISGAWRGEVRITICFRIVCGSIWERYTLMYSLNIFISMSRHCRKDFRKELATL